jgi:hypothetical protein
MDGPRCASTNQMAVLLRGRHKRETMHKSKNVEIDCNETFYEKRLHNVLLLRRR